MNVALIALYHKIEQDPGGQWDILLAKMDSQAFDPNLNCDGFVRLILSCHLQLRTIAGL
jgi:hypothetical protein